MTKTKEVDVHNSPTHLVFASPKERRLHLRLKMDSGGGTEVSGTPQHDQPNPEPPGPGKKKINRAPSPARPKDVPGWSLTKIRGGIGAPTLSIKPGNIHIGSRISRRSPAGSLAGKAEKSGAKPGGKSSSSTATSKTSKPVRRKVSDASIGSDDLSKDSGCPLECPPGKSSPTTDSSSELSDCPSADAVSSDAESRSSRGGGPPAPNKTPHSSSRDRLGLGLDPGEGGVSPGEEHSLTSLDSRVPASSSLAFSDLTEELMDGIQDDFIREIEELRSENDYLKDEMEELRSEMLEMRDMYMEDDVYQLQDLRQQLEQANKTCRILQYRLRKSERRSLRVAQTGQVDGELIRTLEQDVKVSKDVSIRLHSQLDSVEKKRSRLDLENEELRVRLQDLEVAKQVLQHEIDKNSQKKRGARANNKPDKKLTCPQEDSSDLKCQLHFAKEESALMCKKLTKLVKDSEDMKEELAKYRSLYGDVNASLTLQEVADSPHTREAEIRVHLKLVEEEANLLSRRIVELEVENRGLRAEMDDMKGPQDGCQDLTGGGLGAGLVLGGGALVLGGGASSENVMELQRHLQFVEEEAELLRRSLMEMEEQNKLLMNEINRYKSEITPPNPNLPGNTLLGGNSVLGGNATLNHTPVNNKEGAELISPDGPAQEGEELRLSRLQVSELSGKVKKLQYENRVLLSNLQRCDLASYTSPSSSSSSSLHHVAMETDAEAGDSTLCLPNPPQRREPVGGESPEGRKKLEDDSHDALLAMRDQARLVSTAIQLLTSPESSCLAPPPSLYHKVCTNQETETSEKAQISELSDLSDRPLVGALTSRLQALHSKLQAFIERVDGLGRAPPGALDPRDPRVEGGSPPAGPRDPRDPRVEGADLHPAVEKPPDLRNQSEPALNGQSESSVNQEEEGERGASESVSVDLQTPDLQTPDPQTPDPQTPDLQTPDLQTRPEEAPGPQEEQQEEQKEKEEEEEKEEEQKAQRETLLSELQAQHHKALVRCDFQLQSVSLQSRLQQRLWIQERTLLVQESQHLKQALLLLSLKLRCFLKTWRLGGRKDNEWNHILEMNSLKDLYLALEEENLTSSAHQNTADQSASPTIKSSAVSSSLADLQVALMELSSELRLERKGSQELTQKFAKAKASWEVERSELKSLITQLESKCSKAAAASASVSECLDPPDLKALRREREEHQHLLADSYAAVMDLTKQLQLGERNWSREKLELLERFSQEKSQWEQRLGDTNVLQSKNGSSAASIVTNGASSPRTKSMDSEVNGSANQEERIRLTRRNWTCLTNETLELGEVSKTWDGSVGSHLDLDSVQRSFTAPDRTGIRIYYSPPTVRRMEHRPGQQVTENGVETPPPAPPAPPASSSFSSSYEQWLSSLSQQHRELLESRSVWGSIPGGGFGSVDSSPSSSSFHGLELGEISANLSDDMKEMTNCVRQAIRSSSLERKSKEPESKVQLGTSSRWTQTVSQCVSVGLQTDALQPGSRGSGLQTDSLHPGSRGAGLKAWSPRPQTSSLASARTRQISSSLDKVHSRIERPCCSPKYGSPKLQRRVSTGSTSRLDASSSSSRDRSLWSLQQRSLGGGAGGAGGGAGGGSAWARSTTTRDSPVLSGLTDGLSSLFSVVEHAGSTESLWRGDTGSSPGRQPPAAGKPSSLGGVCGSESGSQRYGGLVQDFFSSRGPGGPQSILGGLDEAKPEGVTMSNAVGVLGSLTNDSVNKIITKRLMRQTAGEEMVSIMGGGKESIMGGGGGKESIMGGGGGKESIMGGGGKEVTAGSGLEDAPCDCVASCLSRPSRAATRHSLSHCKHRPLESEERGGDE